jgi:hypothetical protein
MPLPTWKHRILAALPIAIAAGFAAAPVMEQPASYHLFADIRAFCGVPNFGDVASNLGFLCVGIYGLLQLRRGVSGIASRSWAVMIAGVVLVSLGSAYYHLAPTNETLVWDRLPMTFAFTAMTVAVISEFVSEKFERIALVPVVTIGAASVFIWYATGDLRLYFWVQVTSVAAVLFSIFAFGNAARHRFYILGAGVLYGSAILAEQLDHEIFDLLFPILSGHTLKHLLAAGGLLMFPLRLRRIALENA